MVSKRLQNRIAESRMALPITALYAIIMWISGGLFTHNLWLQFALFVISTYLLIELNNKNALIRIYSRMVSCSFIVMTLASTGWTNSMGDNIVQLCIIAFYMLLFNSYQDKKSAGLIFYAFACLGMASLIFVQVLYFVPFIWIIMLFNIQSLSFRTFWASVFGLIIPYCVLGCYYFFSGNISDIETHFHELSQFGTLAQYTNLSINEIVIFAYVAIIALTGSIHFIRTNYNDKIRTRMLFNTFIIMDLLSGVFIVLQPQHFDCLIKIIIINTCPLIGHFISLTRTWLTNVWVLILIFISLLITIFNLWMPSFNF